MFGDRNLVYISTALSFAKSLAWSLSNGQESAPYSNLTVKPTSPYQNHRLLVVPLYQHIYL